MINNVIRRLSELVIFNWKKIVSISKPKYKNLINTIKKLLVILYIKIEEYI